MSSRRLRSDVYRNYRRVRPDLHCFRLVVGESDLWMEATSDCREQAANDLKIIRRQLKEYIYHHPEFVSTLSPWPEDPSAPEIVQWMIAVTRKVGVGPMAAVAGAIAGMLGKKLLSSNKELLIENGGDLFLFVQKSREVAIYAGNSPFSWKTGLRIQPGKAWGLCTSSGTVGPSYSQGQADAVVILSPDPALADAVATATANRIKKPFDLQKAIDFASQIPGISGVVSICGSQMAVWGEIELVNLSSTEGGIK
ncbi:MAG TPA: hypothetical protein DEB05_13005 [Firmicutes bacterium]|nr:hypothetical protein [Bacillota bacterium]HBT17860.1 hypothetical protein [Bacillota bacterium]